MVDNTELVQKMQEKKEKPDKPVQVHIGAKGMLVLVLSVVLLVAAILLLAQRSGQKKAEEIYRDTIEANEAKIEELQKELDNKIAWYENASKEVNFTTVNLRIQEIGELATMEYIYTDAAKFTDSKIFLKITLPWSTKFFVVKWDGILKAGIDVGEIKTEVNEETKVFKVILPQAKILSHEIDSDSAEVLDQSSGLFNPITVDDVMAFEGVTKEAMEQRAIQNGLLEKAENNAKAVLTALINSTPNFEGNYTLVFEKAR